MHKKPGAYLTENLYKLSLRNQDGYTDKRFPDTATTNNMNVYLH